MKTEGNDRVSPKIQTDQAYDSNELNMYGNTYSTGGLTKREYFAAMPMQGYSSKNMWGSADIAKYAVETADALINALNQNK
jgi:hypothetical protein